MDNYEPLSEEEQQHFRRRMSLHCSQYLEASLRRPFIRADREETHPLEDVRQQREQENIIYQETQDQLTGIGPHDRTQVSGNYSDEEWHTLTSYPLVNNTHNLITWLQLYYRPVGFNAPVNPALDIPPIHEISNNHLRTVPLLYMTSLYNLTYPNPLSPQRQSGLPPPTALRDWYMRLPMNDEGNRRITHPTSFRVTMKGQHRYWNIWVWKLGIINARMVNRYSRVRTIRFTDLPTIIISDEDAAVEEEYICY